MNNDAPYPIGKPNQAWGLDEKTQWLALQTIQRSYQQEVLDKLDGLRSNFSVEKYGELSYDPGRYPLFVLKSLPWNPELATVLVTGGVHGYETSGVQGAIRFAQLSAVDYQGKFNFLVVPCISPWGYETINRWNPMALDPNRSFENGGSTEEAAALMKYLETLGIAIKIHFDLHETTDTDNSEFRPALAARDNVEHAIWDIPDGFYAVGDVDNPVPEFQASIIESVSRVTHIADADESGKIIGEAIAQHGVINYAVESLGLCAGVSDCTYATTTEVYPDSPRANDENCILAQVAAIVGGLDYVLNLKS